MKENKSFIETIVRVLIGHIADIATAAREENVPGTLKAIESMIEDLEQIHFAISIANDRPDCENCADTSCPGNPSNLN